MKYTQRLEQQIRDAAEEYLLSQTVVSLPVSGYENYLVSGDRLTFELAYFKRRRQLAVMGLAVYLEDSRETLQFLEQIIWEICNEYTWALPAHLSIDQNEFAEEAPACIDLFAAETGQTLAELYRLIGSKLSPLILQRMMSEIERRILLPFEEQQWAWEQKENNWSAVIAGCLGMTALSLIEQTDQRLQPIIDRLDVSMQSYLRGFGEDGACVEGVSYWSYGFGYFIYYAEMLKEVLQEDRYLKLPKVKAIAAFPYFTMIDQKQFVPFSDYSQPTLPSGLINFCKNRFDVSIPKLAEASSLDFDHCYRFAPLLRNLLWKKEGAQTDSQLTVCHYFSDAQWLMSRRQEPAFFFAAKGGSNEESHNHLDIGHFVLGDINELFLTDLGAGEYTRDYFNEDKRYGYFTAGATSHHIPRINGEEQQPGAVSAENVSFDKQSTQLNFSMELQETYSKNEELRSFRRSFAVNTEQRESILTDHFLFDTADNEVVENFVSQLQPRIEGQRVFLQGKQSFCEIGFETTDITVLTERYRDHSGKEQKAYRIQALYKAGVEAVIRVRVKMNESLREDTDAYI
ncbi:hypothetical protein I6N96_06245 [Enterococcus sp. BWM-S5]|uniref:Heparinase II/III-like protein n=1 Tax=Enterococcus larvae TaxID=2794352 RepID=A0ABS4CHH8_9ENTE|nr:hypothetical protein [Enterococcus larvae]MBP1045875.1 hypothetical protein [Enterococcus larvae]